MPSPTGEPPTNELDPDDPEVAAVLSEMARQYERAWLDDAIPALAGHTPREAAADPTRRPDLIRLLDSFPREQDRPGLMNPDPAARRTRTALSIGRRGRHPLRPRYAFRKHDAPPCAAL